MSNKNKVTIFGYPVVHTEEMERLAEEVDIKSIKFATLAQLVERLFCKQLIKGSNPLGG